MNIKLPLVLIGLSLIYSVAYAEVVIPPAFNSRCSGFYISETNIVTAAHCVTSVGDSVIATIGNDRVAATVVVIEKEKDIAILQLVSSKTHESFVLGDVASVGTTAHALGWPEPANYGEDVKYSIGHVMAVSDGQEQPLLLVVHGGNSGGAIFNQYGEIIGVLNLGMNDSPANSFMVPVDVVKKILTEHHISFTTASAIHRVLIDTTHVVKTMLGLGETEVLIYNENVNKISKLFTIVNMPTYAVSIG